ncbi:hypothetical protein QQF64_019439, partial [Cirrhinus molitorella]
LLLQPHRNSPTVQLLPQQFMKKNMTDPEPCRIKQEDTEEQIDLIEEKEMKELIEEGENHHVKTEETSCSSSLKRRDKIWPQCEKTVSCKPNLNIHIKCNLEGQLHKCDQCEKTFTIEGNLTKHMTIHTGEKPYT